VLAGVTAGVNDGPNDRFWPILLKKSVSERAAFRQLKKRSISALLRKNQDRSVF
jgi:hypothetical protein